MKVEYCECKNLIHSWSVIIKQATVFDTLDLNSGERQTWKTLGELGVCNSME